MILMAKAISRISGILYVLMSTIAIKMQKIAIIK